MATYEIALDPKTPAEVVEDPAQEAAQQAGAALRGMEEGRPGGGAGMVEARPHAVGGRPDPRELGRRRQRVAPATGAAGSASSMAAMSDPSWRMRRSK